MKSIYALLLSSALLFSSCSIHVYHHGKGKHGGGNCSSCQKGKCDGKECLLKKKKCPHSKENEEGKESSSSAATSEK